jgi:hypothetical protein
MQNRRLYKIECFHKFGRLESERLKVTALNPFHPTASPLFKKWFLNIAAQSPREREKDGWQRVFFFNGI